MRIAWLAVVVVAGCAAPFWGPDDAGGVGGASGRGVAGGAGGGVAILIRFSVVGLSVIRGATLSVYGRSYNTTASGSFDAWSPIHGDGPPGPARSPKLPRRKLRKPQPPRARRTGDEPTLDVVDNSGGCGAIAPRDDG